MKHSRHIQSLFSLFLALLLIVSLTACGEDSDTSSESSSSKGGSASGAAVSSSVSSQPTQSKEPAESKAASSTVSSTVPGPFNEGLDLAREKMGPSGAIAGIFYGGYYEGEPLTTEFYDTVNENGCLLEYPFMLEIPAERVARNDGGEIFCIVPADPKAFVQVNAWDAETETAGDVLYTSESGEPFWVIGNISDIMPNLAVTIRDEYNNVLKNYHPSISLKDGTVNSSDDDQPLVLDLTKYIDSDNITYSFDMYIPNADRTDLETMRVSIQNLDEYYVVMTLVEQRVIPDNVEILEFSQDGNSLFLDLNVEYEQYLNSVSEDEADLVMNSLVNSYLSAYGAHDITVTVAGFTLEYNGQQCTEPYTFVD